MGTSVRGGRAQRRSGTCLEGREFVLRNSPGVDVSRRGAKRFSPPPVPRGLLLHTPQHVDRLRGGVLFSIVSRQSAFAL
jgi:hypothetical protein